MTLSVIIIVIACITGGLAFHFTDCSTSNSTANRLLNLTHVNISTDPIHIPGNETVEAVIEVLRTVEEHYFTVNVTVKKVVRNGSFKLPCSGHFGSCSYDICTELTFAHLSGIQLACPLQPGTYNVHSKTYHIKKLGSLLSAFAAGDYTLLAEFTDTRTGEDVGCFQLTFTTTTDCTGPLCILG